MAVQSKKYPLKRRTSSLVRATLLRRKISQLNTSATTFLNNIFTSSINNNNNLSASPSLSINDENENIDENSTQINNANSPRPSTSKASSNAESEVPMDPKTMSSSSDELKIEITEIDNHNESEELDEQTMKDADQTLKNDDDEKDRIVEASSSNDEETSDEDDRLVLKFIALLFRKLFYREMENFKIRWKTLKLDGKCKNKCN